ncbi:uroporphyrinogen decarboxylase family protein [Gaoshiqia sediminis]|uniref:Thioredoxin family protein n=1 Tax=Gaoshiqia sediminis TaxID=2986998 RepID=A0AA41Y5B5_9BACT|nr:uroporphyrinogen decarboxylase family protein [Gaoshiqia sediminis]MCW0481796.1 thioredoxin family protein [Gaoshiqia sediminis]
MNGLQLLEKAFRLEQTERAPWVPFVGVHGGKLIGLDAETYLKDPRAIVEGISKAVELYQPDGIPVVFDLQIEAEILGCKLAWSKENPPAVVSHPLVEGVELSSLSLPTEQDGRLPVELEATAALRKKYPDLALYGLITGPFTLALHLLGTEVFMKLFEDPDYVNELMEFCTQVGIRHAEMLLDAGCDVIAVVDPMTSQIDPMSFETFVSPSAKKIFDFVRSKNKYSSFFVCGHAQQNIEVMCDCRPDNISIDENIPLDFVKDIALTKGISFGGNLKLTSVLLLGNELDSKKEAVNCLDLGGDRGFILAPGCDLPMDTPVENLQAVTELVYDDYARQVTREMEHSSSLQPLSLDGHFVDGKVIIDIITLDSSSCAPCQYMVEAVKQAAAGFDDKVAVTEYKIKEVDGIRMMLALGVQNVPTTCINGNVAFISQIPPKSAIVKAIENALNA